MSRIIAIAAVVTFAFGLASINTAIAAEKVKGRDINYMLNSQQIEVPDEDGHVILVYEATGVSTMSQWIKGIEWGARREFSLMDISPTTGRSGHGYGYTTDKDGDSAYWTWQGKQVSETRWEGEASWVKGTGKYEGIKGKGTWFSTSVSPKQWMVDWEGEIEFP